MLVSTGTDGSLVPRCWTQPELLPGIPSWWLPGYNRDKAGKLCRQRSGDQVRDRVQLSAASLPDNVVHVIGATA